jgi:CHAT domain-containing protein/Tfp pilus assembly protein PilF
LNSLLNIWVEKLFSYPFFVFVCLISLNGYSQHSNSYIEFDTIIESEQLSVDSKIEKIDSLLIQYEINEDYEKQFDDIYSYGFWFFRNANYNKAIEVCQKGIDISKKIKKPDPNRHAGLKNTIAASYLNLGDYETSFNRFNNILETVSIEQRLAMAYHGMAECKKYMGDYYAANNLYDKSISIARGLDDKFDHVYNIIDQSDNYHQIANKTLKLKGVASLEEILHLAETDQSYSAVFYPNFELKIHQNIGSLLTKVNDSLFQKSKWHFKTALKIAVSNNYEEEIGDLNNALGYVSMKENSPETMNYLNKALSHLKNIESRSICYSNIAFYFANNNQFDKAILNAQKAIELLVDNTTLKNQDIPTLTELKASSYRHELLTALIDKAEIFIKSYNHFGKSDDLHSALELLNLSDHFTGFIRSESDDTQSKLFWRIITSRIYNNAVDICNKLNQPEKALYYIEKNKALLLLEDILQKKRLGTPDILSLDETQKTLNLETAYINYILNDDLGYGMLITKNEHLLFQISDVNSLKSLSKSYRDLLAKPLTSTKEVDSFNSISKELYAKLIPNKVQNLIKDKTLIISPDYYLQDIPFEALKDGETDNFLIQNHEISYTYSLTFLNANSKINRENEKGLIGFAPVNFGDNLSSLPNTNDELVQISKILNGEAFYNEMAQTSSFNDEINNHSIIHLATHANANDSLKPWIAFHDKLLTLDDLYNTENSAELVVLSACETSLGEIKQGEGVMSLARAFFNTGANTVVSTLWNVNDKSGSEIMIDFYKYLDNGLSKSEALHKAKLDYINSNQLCDQSPYYWASFVLIGDTKQIDALSSNINTTWIIGIILFLILFSFLFKYFKK